MRELNAQQLDEINGGIAPAILLTRTLYGLGYLGSLDTAQAIGRSLGRGFYDGLHKSR